jgi:hypothetical protein
VLWSVLIFCCASRSHRNSNLNWIQISLQIIKRYEKENDFPNSYLVMGRNLAGNRVWPGQPLLSPPPFLFFTRPSPASLWSQPSRFCPDSPGHGSVAAQGNLSARGPRCGQRSPAALARSPAMVQRLAQARIELVIFVEAWPSWRVRSPIRKSEKT